MRKVLIVDDESSIRAVLRGYLLAAGFEVVEAGGAGEALRAVRATEPDVVLLDVGLPDGDGFEVLGGIRAASQAYVIMVTARSEELDRLLGLSAGADDYVTKPFSPREVVARVHAVLRRSRQEGPDSRVDRFGDLVIDAERREVARAGVGIALSALEFDILKALTDVPGRVFSREQLLEKVWGYDFFGDVRVVDVHIRGLRRALADDATSPQLIGTVRGVGYKFLRRRS